MFSMQRNMLYTLWLKPIFIPTIHMCRRCNWVQFTCCICGVDALVEPPMIFLFFFSFLVLVQLMHAKCCKGGFYPSMYSSRRFLGLLLHASFLIILINEPCRRPSTYSTWDHEKINQTCVVDTKHVHQIQKFHDVQRSRNDVDDILYYQIVQWQPSGICTHFTSRQWWTSCFTFWTLNQLIRVML